jgi:hypothetical protein
MEKRKVGPENGGYSAHTTPLPTKIQRPSLTPLQQEQQKQQLIVTPKAPLASSMTRDLLNSMDNPKEMENLLSKYGELIQSRKFEMLEMRQRNSLRQSEKENEATAMVKINFIEPSISFFLQDNHRNGIQSQRTLISDTITELPSTAVAAATATVTTEVAGQGEEGFERTTTPPTTPVVCVLFTPLLPLLTHSHSLLFSLPSETKWP